VGDGYLVEISAYARALREELELYLAQRVLKVVLTP
jgi:hypothetical protein